jgi:hypothetical protein
MTTIYVPTSRTRSRRITIKIIRRYITQLYYAEETREAQDPQHRHTVTDSKSNLLNTFTGRIHTYTNNESDHKKALLVIPFIYRIFTIKINILYI